MSEHTYKLIELVGSSPHGIEAAVENAIKRAGVTERARSGLAAQTSSPWVAVASQTMLAIGALQESE